MFKRLLKTMRPRQWTKNGFIFFALIFDKQLFQIEAFTKTLEGFFLFCLTSRAVYLLNDIADVEADRQHPEKKNRPIASGKLPLNVAWSAAIILILVTLPTAYFLAPALAAILAIRAYVLRH